MVRLQGHTCKGVVEGPLVARVLKGVGDLGRVSATKELGLHLMKKRSQEMKQYFNHQITGLKKT